MATPILNAEIRDIKGKGNVKQAREGGKVPGVIYSRGTDTKEIFLNTRELQQILSKYGQSVRFGLDVAGQKSFVIIKDIQRSSVKKELLHIDLQTLDENETIKMIMPVQLINREQVETADQFIQFNISEVEIQSYPKYLPERIEIDAAKLADKDVLTIADLNIADDENIEILEDHENVVASLVYARVEEPKDDEDGSEAATENVDAE